MIEYILFGSLCLGCGLMVYFGLRSIIREGIKDDLAIPLSNCDTSMFDEIKPEEKKQ